MCDKIIYDKNCNIIVLDNNFNELFVYVYILLLNTTNSVSNLIFIKENSNLKIIFNSTRDGFYTLVTIKVPLNPLNTYYYKEGKFFKNIKEVDLLELIEVNPEISGLEISYDYYFHLCHLRQCYISICLEIFNLRASILCNISNIDKELIYRRDLVGSTLHVIRYLTEIEQYEEAERILERISGCNGLCKNNNNCGCLE